MWLRGLGQVTWVDPGWIMGGSSSWEGPGWVLDGSWVGHGWVLGGSWGVHGSLVALSRLNLTFAQSRLESGFLGDPHLDMDFKS